MSYPETAGFQAHSETSRQAAETTSAAQSRYRVKRKILEKQWRGATGDELADELNELNGTISARLRELELNNEIVKTNKKRKTRRDKNANVYVCKEFFTEDMGRDTVKPIDQRKRNEIVKILRKYELEFQCMRENFDETVDALMSVI
jgi:uncharacterized protein YukE